MANTPIARYDVVPYQRIENNEIFKFGVPAFSKDGISNVSFAISGQGYSGVTPIVATEMTYNDRTNVWEYIAPINGANFSTDGVFTVTATITGDQGDTRVLDALSLNINATGSKEQLEAWVSTAGSDTTGTVGNSALPYLTIAGAVSDIQSAGSSNGAIIYLEDGTYTLASATNSTEYLTITKSATATKETTIVNAGNPTVSLLCLKDISIVSRGGSLYATSENVGRLWTDSCRIIGSGRYVTLSNPCADDNYNRCSTNDYVYDVDRGFTKAFLVRGSKVERTGNDAFSNTYVVINCEVENITNNDGTHGDAYQTHTTGEAPADNRIIYNFHAIDLHISGFFMRSDSGTSTDNAFVNCFIEMRDPVGVDENGEPQHDACVFMPPYAWDHLLVWHCSFPFSKSGFTYNLTNSSFIGNIFRQLTSSAGTYFADYGNSGNNVFSYNHYCLVYGITPSQTLTSYETLLGTTSPVSTSVMLDSNLVSTATTSVLATDEDYTSETFGYPIAGTALVHGVPYRIIPADINQNARISTPDIGAFETDGTAPVEATEPTISATGSLSFTGEVDADNPADKNISISNSGVGTLTWVLSESTDWLSLASSTGACTTETDVVSVSVDTTGLAVGTHTGTITVTDALASNSPQTISVVLVITDVPTSDPTISVTSALSFTGVVDSDNPSDQNLSILNSGEGTLTWVLSESISWLSLASSTGTCTTETDTVAVSIDTTGLAVGTYTGTITVTDALASNSPQTVSISLVITAITPSATKYIMFTI